MHWTRAKATLTPKMRGRLKGHDVEIVKALLDGDSPIDLRVSDAARQVDWNHTDVAKTFVEQLTAPAVRTAQHYASPDMANQSRGVER